MIWQFDVLAHCNEDRAVLIRGPTAGLTPVLLTLLNDVRISSCREVVVGQETTLSESTFADDFYR